jgi:hypothetical protein
MNYPADVPVQEMLNVVKLLRAGTVVENRAQFALDAWVVQGYCQKQILGAPEGTQFVSQAAEQDPLTLIEIVANGEPQPHLLFPWELIASFLLKKIIEYILTNVTPKI